MNSSNLPVGFLPLPSDKLPIPPTEPWAVFRRFIKNQGQSSSTVIPTYLKQKYEHLYTRGPRSDKLRAKPRSDKLRGSRRSRNSSEIHLISLPQMNPIVKQTRAILGKISNSNHADISHQLNRQLMAYRSTMTSDLYQQVATMMYQYAVNCLYLKSAIVKVFISLVNWPVLYQHLVNQLTNVELLTEWYNQQPDQFSKQIIQAESNLYAQIQNSPPPHQPYYQQWIHLLTNLRLEPILEVLGQQLTNHLREFYQQVQQQPEIYQFKDVFMLEELLERYQK